MKQKMKSHNGAWDMDDTSLGALLPAIANQYLKCWRVLPCRQLHDFSATE